MTNQHDLNPVTIPFRKIICKSCQTPGTTDMGFKIFDSQEPGRVTAVCESCGAPNLIKKDRTPPSM